MIINLPSVQCFAIFDFCFWIFVGIADSQKEDLEKFVKPAIKRRKRR